MSEATGATDADGGVRLRPMTVEDIPAALDLEQALFPEDAWTEGMFRDELSHPSRHYVVAESGGRVMGYAGLRSVPPEGDVQTMAVARSLWGRGIGRALLSALLDRAEHEGVVHVFLEVRDDNPRAQKLYADFGFTRIGVRRGYYNGADAIVMRRTARPGQGSGEEGNP